MQRRKLLKGIAAGSAMSVGIAGASGRSKGQVVDIEEYPVVLLKDGERVVERVENPTWDDVKRLNSDSTTSQTVVTPDGSCTEFCCGQCACSSCLCGCNNCCDVDDEICSCCSQVEDPDSTECCSGC